MKIKNQEELANILGMAFRSFSATIATGRGIEEFSRLMEEGRNSIVVELFLKEDGSIEFTDRFKATISQPIPDDFIEALKGRPTSEVTFEAVSPVAIEEDESDANEPELSAEKEIVEFDNTVKLPKRKRKKTE